MRSCLRFLLALAACAVLASILPASADAQQLAEGHQLAFDALTLEFARDHVTGSESELEAKFRSACDSGYNLACQRGAWMRRGRADLAAAESVFEYACESGDPVACMVVGWSLDKRAAQSEDRDRTWRSAARLFKSHCEAGFAPACHEYAWFLYENKGLTADPRAAILRWEPACESGFQPSCTTLATLNLEGGPGVRRNPKEAERIFQLSCDAGHPEACYQIGQLRDSTWTAAEWDAWYGPLCDAGHRDSCWRLAAQYSNGIFQPPTETRTYELFARGCELGNAKACREAGRTHQTSDPPDDEKAGYFFGKACVLGDIGGCASEVNMILSDRVPGTVKDSTVAFENACLKRNVADACTTLAVELMRGVDLPRDPDRARALLHRACVDQDSSAEACSALGQSYSEGQGGDRDRTIAAKYFRWACNAGHYLSCERRGDLLAVGRGIKRDDHEALSMYRRACEGGMSNGCNAAAVIVDEGTYVERDTALAYTLFQKACDGGIGDSCAAVGRIAESADNGPPDYEAARAAYDSGILLTSIEAKRRMARLLWNGLGGKKQRGRARKLAAEACQAGDAMACRGASFL